MTRTFLLLAEGNWQGRRRHLDGGLSDPLQ